MKPDESTAQIATQWRLLASLVRALLARENFDTVAGLTEALKAECGRLKIHWSNDDITAAYQLIESNRSLVVPPRPAPHPQDDGARPFSREEATELCDRLLVAFRREQTPRGRRA
jgi:hypothetical protein